MEKFYSIKNRKAQIWSVDLIIASLIFLFGIFLFYFYLFNQSSQSKDQLEELFYEGNLASQLILSENEIGILSNGKINQTKLDIFYNIDYDEKKSRLGISNNFYFIFDELKIDEEFVNYVGKINSTEIERLVKITRLTIYENKPTKFEIFIWR